MRMFRSTALLGMVFLFSAPAVSESLHDRTNIIFVVDVRRHEAKLAKQLVGEILETIPLTKYRIAIHSTNGLKQRLLDFQTRQCSMKVFKNTHRKVPLFRILHDVYREMSLFRKDKSVIVFFTSTQRPRPLRKRLLRIHKLIPKNKAINLIQLKVFGHENSYGQIVSRFWKTVSKARTSSWKSTREINIEDGALGRKKLLKKLYNWFHFTKVDLRSCKKPKKGSKFVLDECARECDCVNGVLTNCFRVRKQFSKLPLADRKHYIKAYKKLATDSRFNKRFYSIIKIHPTVNFTELHTPEELFPFHRKYTLVMENMFRLVDCRITIPFWNFPLHSQHIFEQKPGYHVFDNDGGFGSTETSVKTGFCLSEGPFRRSEYKLPDFFVRHLNNTDRKEDLCPDGKSYKKCTRLLEETFEPSCVTRSISTLNKIPTYQETFDVINDPKKTYAQFELFVRDSCHASVHDNMGGDFGYGHSSLLPEFFPLHSFIDAMWTYYQNHRPEHKRMWLRKNKYRIIGFHTPRYWYVDNTNLEMCGLKIKYTNIFPVKISLSKTPTTNTETGNDGGELAGGDTFEGFHADHLYQEMLEQDEDEEEEEIIPLEILQDEKDLIFFNSKIN